MRKCLRNEHRTEKALQMIPLDLIRRTQLEVFRCVTAIDAAVLNNAGEEGIRATASVVRLYGRIV